MALTRSEYLKRLKQTVVKPHFKRPIRRTPILEREPIDDWVQDKRISAEDFKELNIGMFTGCCE